MRIKDVFVLKEAITDLHEGKKFYNNNEMGVGDYFWDSLLSDIESLVVYAGIHRKVEGFYQMFSKRFPYAIYYEIKNEIAYVVAVLPMRRDPIWNRKKIMERS
ncbi:Toxin-antitoxin system, toxin component RelE/ParE-like domain-containing protein [Desulfonema limicola]|uniref:Toxin-antitoxin system, toxin component RelE/ParE-like domain-containing protein n=1 Tax=Desulfonema limicola TaxID=45656 RepID=A0A975GJG6_9BACT|nr:type II toxin-antitoxin system RelE/ParE family toxin [Desulfonema limicola]QTA83696.1 Toxin-antitoxin system, toxin component RelE/ParE-like domain-containing protein [Desulfonema limicola]